MKILSIIICGTIILNAGNYTFEAFGKNKTKRTLTDMSQFVSKNISRKRENTDVISECKDVDMFTSDDKMILTSNSFGPLPVIFKIINKQGKEIVIQTNEDNLTSRFEIPTQKLKNGSKLQVLNAFDEMLFCNIIHIKENHQSR